MTQRLRPTTDEKVRAWRLIEVAKDGHLITPGMRRDWFRRCWWTNALLKQFIWVTLSERMEPIDFEKLYCEWIMFKFEMEETWKK